MTGSTDSIVELYRAGGPHFSLVSARPQVTSTLFSARALVDGTTLAWEEPTNHQIEHAVAAVEAALDDLA